MVREIRLDTPASGKAVITRTAVKAIVRLDAGLLLMLTPSTGDLKFPGGGVEPGEDHLHALRRELLEETGREVTDVGEHLVTVIERRQDSLRPDAIFEMTSFYYECRVGQPLRAPTLDARELELDLTAVIVPAAEALNSLNEASNSAPWVVRERHVLQLVADKEI